MMNGKGAGWGDVSVKRGERGAERQGKAEMGERTYQQRIYVKIYGTREQKTAYREREISRV